MKSKITVAEIILSLAPAMSTLVLVEGVLVLLGWGLQIEFFKNPFPNETPVAFSTGLCFILTALALIFMRVKKESLAKCSSAASILVCSAICAHYVIGTFDLDQFFNGSGMGLFGPNRMSPTILFSFLIVDSCMFMNRSKQQRVIDFLMLFANVLCLTALTAHYFEVPSLMRISTLIQMATPSALAGLLMSWAFLFLEPDKGMISVLSEEGASGKFVRHFLVPAIFVPLISGKIFLLGLQSGLYDVALGTALVALFVICCIAGAIWSVAGWLDHAEKERIRAQEDAISSAQSSKAILDASPVALSMIDVEGNIIEWNKAAERLFGWTRDEVIGKKFDFTVAPSEREIHLANVNQYKTTGTNKQLNQTLEIQMVRKDGTEFPGECIPFEVKSEGKIMLSAFMQDISARKEAEQRINEFISTVSHELRTPLTSIKGALRLIEGGIAGDVSDDALALVNVATTETERLIRIVNDILDLKKIEAGKLELRFDDVEAINVLNDALEGIDGMAKEFGIELKNDTMIASGTLHCDKDRIIQVLHNLISNAIKFSPEGETVTLQLSEIDEGLKFSVKDHGSGIPESQAHKLFGRFQQLDSSDTRQQGGTGLGLAISKAIIKEHAGTIGFESVVGEGSVFWFTLPAKQVKSLKPGDLSIRT